MDKPNRQYTHHYEEAVTLQASPQKIFDFANNHENLSYHMNKSSMMMGGGSMVTKTDDGKGQQLGSHIMMSGTAFGFKIFLDEIITEYNPPFKKAWETVGEIKILVLGHYRLGFEIQPAADGSEFKVFIDYLAPHRFYEKILSFFLGKMYAKWCVRQLINGVSKLVL